MHAAAIHKALEMRKPSLAAIVYSGVDPRIIGKMPDVKVGPMSGRANVILKLKSLKLKSSEKYVKTVLEYAKKDRHLLTD